MSLVCALSGFPPEDAVVTPSGYLYEKRLIEKEIELHGKCPVTGQETTKEQLLPLHVSKVTKPRPLTASSVPGLLSLFQNEWDALMHETFQLRQHLDKVRCQLSTSLYQHDAALRVIARIVRERDAARQQLQQLQQRLSEGAVPEVVAEPTTDIEPGLSAELLESMQQTAQVLLQGRKKRQVEGLTKAEKLSSFECSGRYPIHSSTEKGVRCVDIDPKNPNRIATGGMDNAVVLFDTQTNKSVGKLLGHRQPINSVKVHPRHDVVLSCSDDRSIRVWAEHAQGSWGVSHVIRKHKAEVCDLSLHPLDNYFASSSRDRSWAFYEIESGRCLKTSADLACEYRCLSFHPDGMILAGGGSDGGVHIWDLKGVAFRAALTGHDRAVTGMSFSENGFYMATASEDGTVRLWDLRKSLSFQTITAENDKPVNNVQFDFTGNYLAVCASSLSVYNFESRVSVACTATFDDNTEPVTDAKFGPLASFIVSTSMDRVVRKWESPQPS
eukprot:GHVS01095995.1.p1 GENE.GHVS01095995.1~~GHVS01095995.1.p1  ORF type:complete len:498 (-),score=72.93 GHVS01095995.1:105-1598(-)